MEGAHIEFFGEDDIQEALILVAFPTTGLVASIAAQFLIDHLELPLVGSVHVQSAAPIAAITGGLASSPIRIYGGEVECNLKDRRCPRVFLVTTEMQLGDALFEIVGNVLLDWAGNGGANMVLCLEGVVRDDDETVPKVYGAGGEQTALDHLLTIVPALERAMLGGVAAALLTGARSRNVCVAALVVEAQPNNPDGRAAVALIKALDQLIPSVSVDTKPLEEEARELEATVRRAQAQAQAQAPSPASTGAFI